MNLWTQDMDDKLRALVSRGYTTRQIAAEMGKSKNAIIGRANRAGIKLNSSRIIGNGAGSEKKKKRFFSSVFSKLKNLSFFSEGGQKIKSAASKFNKPLLMPAIKTKNLTIFELTSNTCRWPVSGEKEKTLFCGNASIKDKPYCSFHHAIAYYKR